MKDEIKEILNKWKCYIELTKKFTTNEYEMLRVEDIDKILDYITNLQDKYKGAILIGKELNKENERLKQERQKKANPYSFYDKDELIDEILKNEDELERYKNIIDELEKWLELVSLQYKKNDIDDFAIYENVSSKLKELKGE